MSTNVRPNNVIEITAKDLPLHCPTEGVALWSNHPRVFLPLEEGQARCPYCGTVYKLIGDAPAGH